jgi:hypothetical protein
MDTPSPTTASPTTYCILNIDNNTESDVIKHHMPFLRDSSVKNCGIKIKLHRDYVREPDVIVYFQGELYNTSSILRILDMSEETPVENMIIQLYKKYGMQYTLQILDGSFMMILFDYYYLNDVSKIYVVRDIFGRFPIYLHRLNHWIMLDDSSKTRFNDTQPAANSVEKKSPGLCGFLKNYKIVAENVNHPLELLPSHYYVFELSSKISTKWKQTENICYYMLPITVFLFQNDTANIVMYKCLLMRCLETILQKYYPDGNSAVISKKLLGKFWEKSESEQNILLENQMVFSAKNTLAKFQVDIPTSMFLFDSAVRKSFFEWGVGGLGDNGRVTFEKGVKYVFFDKEFISFYFSVPLEIRYYHHNELFSQDTGPDSRTMKSV